MRAVVIVVDDKGIQAKSETSSIWCHVFSRKNTMDTKRWNQKWPHFPSFPITHWWIFVFPVPAILGLIGLVVLVPEEVHSCQGTEQVPH